MSIVVAVKNNERVVIASDSQTSFGDHSIIEGNGKLIRTGDNIIGLAGWGIYSNLFQIYLQGNPLSLARSEIDVFQFFVDFWKVLKSDYTFVSDKSTTCESPFAELDSTFIVATPKDIFYVADDMSVVKFSEFYAIGSGSSFALGALRVIYGDDYSTEEMAKKAVEVSIGFNNSCGGKVNLEVL